MALALYFAMSTGQWDALHHATPAEPGLFNAAGSADWKGVPEPVNV